LVLIAWTLLEAFHDCDTIRLLLNTGEDHDKSFNLGLPLSWRTGSIDCAGNRDRLRDQRAHFRGRKACADRLSHGVLNRRSLVERLDSACIRARARGLPISLLFIDLDHFRRSTTRSQAPAAMRVSPPSLRDPAELGSRCHRRYAAKEL